MNEINAINKKLDGYKNYIIELQTEMTSRPAMSPQYEGGTGEYDKSVYLESELKKLKFDKITHLDAPDKRAKKGIRPNIAAVYNGKDTSKTFWIMGHMDIVPPGDLKLWKTDPFKATVKGDYIYGRGTEDNQQGIVSGLLAIRALMELNIRPAINVGLLLVADEELSSKFGVEYVLNKYPKFFGKNDFVAVPDFPEPKGLHVEISEKDILWVKLTTKGKEGHAAMPHNCNNAFIAGSALVNALYDGLHKKFNKKDKMFNPPFSTFQPTKKDPNVQNVNTIPGTDVFYVDCRILPGIKEKDILAEMKKIAATVEKKFKVKVEVAKEKLVSSIPTPKTAPVVKAFEKAVQAVHKKKANVIGIGGGTVAAYFRNKKIDSIVMGKADVTLHSPNEYSKISNTILDAKVIANAILLAK